MSVQSVSNSLSAQQILQLLQQQQVANADANDAGPTAPDAAASTGQNVPTGTDANTDPSGGAATAAPKTLDPKTILALLQIQESQSMSQVNALFFGDQTQSTGTNDPLLSLDDSSSNSPPTTDPLLAALNAQSDSSQASLDNVLGLRSNIATSASASSNLSTTNDAVMKLLASLGIGTAPTATATASTTAAEATVAAGSTDATES